MRFAVCDLRFAACGLGFGIWVSGIGGRSLSVTGKCCWRRLVDPRVGLGLFVNEFIGA